MKHTIRIKKRGPRDLCFDLDEGASRRLATSAGFDTICRLERGLAVLVKVSPAPESAAVERVAEATSIGPSSRRRRARFIGSPGNNEIRAPLCAVAAANVIDERPADQRRTDRSDRLCDLER